MAEAGERAERTGHQEAVELLSELRAGSLRGQSCELVSKINQKNFKSDLGMYQPMTEIQLQYVREATFNFLSMHFKA